jgi:hypothetical protein
MAELPFVVFLRIPIVNYLIGATPLAIADDIKFYDKFSIVPDGGRISMHMCCNTKFSLDIQLTSSRRILF